MVNRKKRRATPARREGDLLPPYMHLTPRALKQWRLGQINPATGKPASQPDAARWYGCSVRAWQYWEAEAPKPSHAIPLPLKRRVAEAGRIFPITQENGL